VGNPFIKKVIDKGGLGSGSKGPKTELFCVLTQTQVLGASEGEATGCVGEGENEQKVTMIYWHQQC
jgi:hypothetical protein